MIQRRRDHKTQVGALLNPVDGYRGSLQKKGVKPKNHISSNTKSIKQAQQEFKMKQQAEIEAKRESNFKLKKFSNVTSRVYNYSKRPQTCIGPRTVTEPLVDRCSTLGVDFEDDKENFNLSNVQKSEYPGKNGNFIHKNIKKAWEDKKELEIQRPQTASVYGGEKYKSKGKVPTYLVNRKEEWKQKEEEKQKQAELKKIPPGTKLLPEDERLATLDQLRHSRQEIENMLESLPISMRTMALRNKKLDLEAKLKEIEAAIKLFSKENVFVAI